MSGLQLKSNPTAAQGASGASGASGAVPAAGGPPPLPSKPQQPSLSVPPPPPPQAQAVPAGGLPTPTSTSMNMPAQPSKKSGGSGVKIFVWVVVLLAVNGIGFGVYWFTRGGAEQWLSGAMEEAFEEIEMIEEETWDAVLDPAVEQAMYEEAYQIDWPVLVLSGMVATTTEEKTSAILNGSLITLFQGIEGATLIEVRDDGVVLQYDRTRKFIRVGEST